ncbi:glycoside hydrolase family 6 protein [Streptomyces sp. ACA25]|uniref:glycoside hydrolase family 6 protein n=1 Tax=Streptomyces sp. ACA25 TaxID=3022596 RepID=UPI0023082D21|nr:glycoside hydrolase family 6 protein [Streptomyces sp. ACA25]MDB1090041.1 glycoside hydrolase family 6 protein [Streptomyces sp. ACA25]
MSEESRKHYRSRRRRLGVLVGGVVAALAGGLMMALPQQAAAELPSGTQFYKDPDSQVARWTAAHQGDHRQPLISQVIGERPQGIWFANYTPSTVTQDVRAVTGPAAAAGQVPVLVAYQMPNRDCGGASSGGAPSHQAYGEWIDRFAAGLGNDPVVVILEPDALALISCLDSQELASRYASMSRAGAAIRSANPSAKVYFDAGHSSWNSPAVQADRLRSAGVTQNGDGIYSNASNFRATPDEVAFTKAVLAELGTPGLGAVIDTSRNGRGPTADSEWCDPSGRGVGLPPTADTGDPDIDAFLWIKPPGEVDGCAGPAGQFNADIAYELAQNAQEPGSGTTGGGTAGGSSGGTTGGSSEGTTDGGSTGGTTAGGATTGGTTGGSGDGCSATYAVVNEWSSGFSGEVRIACDGASLNGWNVDWEFTGGQQLDQAWNATCTQSGSQVSCRSADWNAVVADGSSVTIGFNATSTGSNPAPARVNLS